MPPPPPIPIHLQVPRIGVVSLLLDRTPRILCALHEQRIGRQRWRTLRPFVWYNGTAVHMLPAGYEWNGASVPGLAHWYLEPGQHLEASGPHDHAYQYHWLWTWSTTAHGWIAQGVSKRQADAEWKLILGRILRIRWSKARALWDAVRFCGFRAFHTRTCNRQCGVCPCNAASWCPYAHGTPTPGFQPKEPTHARP